MIELADVVRRGRVAPHRLDAGAAQHLFGAAAARRRHQEHADALPARAAGAAAAMLQHFGVVGQFGMNDQVQIGQVDAARRHIGGDADPRAPIAQRLQRMVALMLAEFAGERHHRKAAFQQHGFHVAHRIAGVAEDQGARRIQRAQQVDHRAFHLGRSDTDGAVFDIGMAAGLAHRGDAQGVALVMRRQIHDGLGQGGGEQKRAPFRRRGLQDELQILAEAHVEHLVGFIEHGGLERRDVERAAFQMIAQAARRADHDMGAGGQFAALAARVHAADTGDDARAGITVEPGEFALHLKRQLARRRDYQGQRRTRRSHRVGAVQQCIGDGQAVGDGLARPGLCRHQKVAAFGILFEHGGLHRGGQVIFAFGKGAGEGGRRGVKRQGNSAFSRLARTL